MRRMGKKGFLDEIVDDLYAAGLLLLAFLIAFVSFTGGQQDTLIHYKTSLQGIDDERALNLYLKYPVGERTQLVDFLQLEDAAEEALPVVARNYFDAHYGANHWWKLEVKLPGTRSIEASNKEDHVGQRVAATLTLPSEEGLIEVRLLGDKHVEAVLMLTRNPVAALWYWIFG